jgi:hypothetical protein
MNSGGASSESAPSTDAEKARSCPSHNYSFFKNSISESGAQ